MSQTQAQLVGNVVTGAVFAGVVTTTSANIGGGAVGINSTGINVVGVITATNFRVGSAITANSSGINVTGIVTASSFSGDGSNLTDISINRFLSVGTRVGFVTVTAFVGILTVFGRTSDTNILV
jgi:hypothetical protein